MEAAQLNLQNNASVWTNDLCLGNLLSMKAKGEGYLHTKVYGDVLH